MRNIHQLREVIGFEENFILKIFRTNWTEKAQWGVTFDCWKI